MKKSMSNLGKILTKDQQKQINGGGVCRQQGWMCCETGFGGQEFCDAGRCNWPWGCFWY